MKYLLISMLISGYTSLISFGGQINQTVSQDVDSTVLASGIRPGK